MKKNLASLFLLFAEVSLQGAEKNVSPTPIRSSDGSSVYIAPMWEYGVSDWGDGSEQKGSLWGASIGYSYKEQNSLYFNLEFTAAAGKWSGSARNDPTQEYITEMRLGYVAVPCCERLTLTPFLGVGSYVFNQSIPGPNFSSYFWYIPIGVLLEYRINNSWAIGLIGTGAPTFSGSYKITKRRNAPTTALWKAEIPVTYFGSLPFECSIIPFFKQWAYLNHGELIKQKNMYYGLKVGFGYHF